MEEKKENKNLGDIGAEGVKGDDTASKYIDAINDLKKNTVSKDEYERLKGENAKLITALANGEQIQLQKQPVDKEEEKKQMDELKEKFTSKQLSNLEMIQASLKLREYAIKNGEIDPYLPVGPNYQPTSEDYLEADKVAKVFQECVETANGDSNAFTLLMQQRMKNPPQLQFLKKK